MGGFLCVIRLLCPFKLICIFLYFYAFFLYMYVFFSYCYLSLQISMLLFSFHCFTFLEVLFEFDDAIGYRNIHRQSQFVSSFHCRTNVIMVINEQLHCFTLKQVVRRWSNRTIQAYWTRFKHNSVSRLYIWTPQTLYIKSKQILICLLYINYMYI